MSTKKLFVIRGPLELSVGRHLGSVTVVVAFNSCMKKIWSSVDVKLEIDHLERTKEDLGNASQRGSEMSFTR